MSFLLNIQDKIAEAIEGIKKSSGYNLNWGSINERKDTFKSYPSAWIFFDGETGENELNETSSGAYSNILNVRLTIKTKVKKDYEFDPRLNNRVQLYSALEDIKKAFANGIIEDSGVEPPIYKDFEIVDSEDKNPFKPSHLIINFEIKYNQDRTNPSQIAC